MNTINREEVKLKTLANKPIAYRNLLITPKSLDTIIESGYDEYNYQSYLATITLQELLKDVNEEVELDISVIEFFIHNADSEILVSYLNSISFFIDESIGLSSNMEKLVIKDEEFDFYELGLIIEIIKIQNCIVSRNDDDFNPLNENARLLKQKMLERQRKLKKLKEGEGGDNSLNFSDLISILCSNANGISIHNVFNLNFFQFNDQFNRMKLLDEYEINIQALLHGADSKNIKLTHWISKVE